MAKLKLTNAKLKSVAVFTAMMLASPTTSALGLGSLEVQSNLDQPFNGEIELRVATGDDLGSVAASIASREDFTNLNIDYPAYLSDMRLTVETVNGNNVLRINSNGVVINEPFIHFLVRVNWSGGSFLREYTALIDPPVYASETPTAIAQPRVVGVDQSTSQSNAASSNVVSNDQVYSSPSSNLNLDAQYGPVSRGESLSQIAQDLQQQFPDLSIYQIMKVLFDENTSSFIDGNINGLMAGVVLNVADLNTIRSADIAQSRAFYLEQINSWDPSSLVSSDSAVKVGQDDYLYNDDNLLQDDQASSTSESQSDTFQVGSTSDGQSLASASQDGSQQGEVIALQQEVTDLQTSLSSSSLENQELKERISILEGQLADLNRLMSLGVEDADLANLEATLANQNNADELLDSTFDSANDFALSTDESVDEFLIDESDESLLDDGTALLDDGTTLLDDGTTLLGDDISIPDVTAVEEVLEIEEVIEPEVSTPPAVVSLNSQSSFFDNGLFKTLGTLGAVILAGLGLFMWRRRKADEEFEVSMMTIESHDSTQVTVSKNSEAQTVTEPSVVADLDAKDAKAPSQNEETSFLTVYSDSDAVVQADEVDPIAEADVYIAYGRNEQAEEVLLDGIASSPERIDIKHKLLSLYHKNDNKQGFERIAEELYAQKDDIDGDVWQQVSIMGKELLPNNPMFEMTAEELFVETKVENDDKLDLDAEVVDDVTDSAETPVDVIEFNDPKAVADEPKALDDDQDSIHLVHTDEDVSGLDEVEISGLNLDLDENSNATSLADSDIESMTESLVQEVSDLDIDADYDEARTQYELAKVFVDLGDEDGARKILSDIVDNKSNDTEVLDDATKLLESIS